MKHLRNGQFDIYKHGKDLKDTAEGKKANKRSTQ